MRKRMKASAREARAARAASEATAAAAPGGMPVGQGSAKGTPAQPRQLVPLPPQTPHQSYCVGGRVRVGGRPSQPRQVEALPPQTPQMSTGRVQTLQLSLMQLGQLEPSPPSTRQGSR